MIELTTVVSLVDWEPDVVMLWPFEVDEGPLGLVRLPRPLGMVDDRDKLVTVVKVVSDSIDELDKLEAFELVDPIIVDN